MRRKRLVLVTTLSLLLAFLPATVSAHGVLDELDPSIVGPTFAIGLTLFVTLFRFMLTGPAWLFGLPDEPGDDDRVIVLLDERTRRQQGYRRGLEERREEERPWRGRSAG